MPQEAPLRYKLDTPNLFSIRGKVALVTGGSRRNRAHDRPGDTSRRGRGCTSRRGRRKTCDAVAADLAKIGTCFSIPADLATAEGRQGLVDELTRREAALHILVNNAGTVFAAPLGEYPEAGFRKVMTVNTEAVFFLTQALLPLLAARVAKRRIRRASSR